MVNEESSTYSPEVRDRILHPRNRGPIATPNGVGHDENPVCGDVMTVWIRVQEGIVREAGFEVQGCAPSIAAGSVVTDLILDRSLSEAREIQAADVENALGGLPRVKKHCALLASRAARLAIKDYESR